MKGIEKINSDAGKRVVFFGNEREDVEFLSSGVESFDMTIGGFPTGRITELSGQPGVTKTSMCLYFIGIQQQQGKKCVFVDAEHSFDADFAAKLGVKIDELIVVQGECGEENFEAVEQLLLSKMADIVVIDSVPALIPRAEIEADLNKPTMGGQARLIASGLRRIIPLAHKRNAVVIFINQLRMNLGYGNNPYITPGGMALKFYSSLRVEMKKSEAISLSGGKSIDGYKIKFVCRKNKVGRPFTDFDADFLFEDGFTSNADFISAGVARGVIQREGNTYTYKDQKLGIGKKKVLEYVNGNPELREEILEAVKSGA